MKATPGFLTKFYDDVQSLPPEDLKKFDRLGGLDLQDIVSFLTNPIDYTVDYPEDISEISIKNYSSISSEIYDLGQKALLNNEVCLVIYSSEQDEILPTSKLPIDISLLSLKHIQSLGIQNVWYVVPTASYDDVRSSLSALSHSGNVKVFKQFESVQLNPDNTLHKKNNMQQYYSCGTGDAINLFIENNDLQRFLSEGGKYLYFIDISNILAQPDPSVLGYHISSLYPITHEIVKRDLNEIGPTPCNFLGSNQVIENFRLSFETANDFQWLATGSFIVRADLDFSSVSFPWHRMKRKTKGKLVIQYERFINDITTQLKTNFVEINRENGYQILKTQDDLIKLQNSFGFK